MCGNETVSTHNYFIMNRSIANHSSIVDGMLHQRRYNYDNRISDNSIF